MDFGVAWGVKCGIRIVYVNVNACIGVSFTTQPTVSFLEIVSNQSEQFHFKGRGIGRREGELGGEKGKEGV